MHITVFQKLSIFFLRVSLGWLMLYAGITKLIDPTWSAVGYLKAAKTFVDFYRWFTLPGILPVVNFVNEWGLIFLGVSLILGIFVRLSSFLGFVLMLLYYFPILDVPYPNPHSYIVDEHVIYALALAVLGSVRAGRMWGLETWCSNLPVCSRFPRLRAWLG
ncbi:MAG: hypothetical protein G01um101470_309 [Parcubacteria group bacterium Gr01-1014_70]|nr:MAG: hypothetical protein G01um101470_309 [Parcubacteria group bacterium Gr01-1014_70]